MTDHDYLLSLKPAGPLLTIKEQVCAKHGITMTDLLSRRRAANLVAARFEGYWRARTETTASYPEIARAFNRGDHTTVMYGCRKHEKKIAAEIAKSLPQE